METEKLYHIADEKFWHQINETHSINGGAYKIIALDNNGRRMAIGRFLDIDINGILYIGKATSFLDRVINLKKSISEKYNGTSHICGRRYKSNPNIAAKFPFNTLYMELMPSVNPSEKEKELLLAYKTKFGEAPPLNVMDC